MNASTRSLTILGGKTMKKLALVLALAFVLSLGLSLVSFAHVDGQRDQYEWTVPKINPENPAINFDGYVDLEGEWNGAVCVPIDFSEDSPTYEEVTLWPQGVWNGSFNFNSYDECDPMWNMTINTYFLWDEDGLYIATKCDDCKVYRDAYTAKDYLDYLMGRADSYSGGLGFHLELMICCNDSADAYVNDPDGHWPNFFMGTIPENTPCWYADYPDITSADEPLSDLAKKFKHGQRLAAAADENGYHPFSQEIFIPWEYINGVGHEGDVVIEGKVGTAGTTFTAGLIYSVRSTDDEQPRMKLTNAQGWRHYDFYSLSATPAEKSSKQVEAPVEEEPTVEEPTVEEPTVEEPAAEEPAEETVTPAPTETTTTTKTNPKTADVSVLFYALAAISAIGGISVFKRR